MPNRKKALRAYCPNIYTVPFGMPHGAGVRILSKKSKAKSLAIGKFKRTWPWQEIAKTDIRKTISNLPQCIIYLF